MGYRARVVPLTLRLPPSASNLRLGHGNEGRESRISTHRHGAIQALALHLSRPMPAALATLAMPPLASAMRRRAVSTRPLQKPQGAGHPFAALGSSASSN